MNWIRESVTGIVLLKISIAAIAFHRRNDTPPPPTTVVARFTPSTHSLWTSPGCVHPEIILSLSLFVQACYLPYIFVFRFKLSIGSFDRCHISALNALILAQFSVLSHRTSYETTVFYTDRFQAFKWY